MRALWVLGLVFCASCATSPPATQLTAASPLDPVVRHIATLPLRWAPPGTADVKRLARGHNAFVALLRMDPGAAVPMHRDVSEEYIYVLAGTGTIVIDGTSTAIGPGTIIFMPSGAEVRYQNGDQEMIALQVFAGPESAAKYQNWRSTKP